MIGLAVPGYNFITSDHLPMLDDGINIWALAVNFCDRNELKSFGSAVAIFTGDDGTIRAFYHLTLFERGEQEDKIVFHDGTVKYHLNENYRGGVGEA